MRHLMIVAVSLAAGGLVFACKDEEKSACEKYCEASIAEYQDYLDENDCELDNESKYVDECVEECDDAMDDIGSGDKEEAEACIECVYDEVGSSPGYGDINEAIEDDCEDECWDDEGMWEFLDEFDGVDIDEDDLDCGGGGGYDNVGACQDLEDTINGLSCWEGEDVDMMCDNYADYDTCDYTDYFNCTADCYSCDGDILDFDSDYYADVCVDLAAECY
ncbi:MAG TPA: hypothetical protein VM285_10085 [Polyangia bacterium]|nr:hypothetical protein [Polyangia bacterium]